jgi:hypothetical protein
MHDTNDVLQRLLTSPRIDRASLASNERAAERFDRMIRRDPSRVLQKEILT